MHQHFALKIDPLLRRDPDPHIPIFGTTQSGVKIAAGIKRRLAGKRSRRREPRAEQNVLHGHFPRRTGDVANMGERLAVDVDKDIVAGHQGERFPELNKLGHAGPQNAGTEFIIGIQERNIIVLRLFDPGVSGG